MAVLSDPIKLKIECSSLGHQSQQAFHSQLIEPQCSLTMSNRGLNNKTNITRIFTMRIGQLPTQFHQRPIIIVMGVSGSGKTTLAKGCATHYSLPFIEGDDYHPQSNLNQMAQGIALGDDDRWPWLDQLGQAIKEKARLKGGAIASGSSLKKRYRQYLAQVIAKPLVFVYLHGSREGLMQRVSNRKDHIMPPSLLDSQLNTLEIPSSDEPVITVSTDDSVGFIIESIDSILRPLIVP